MCRAKHFQKFNFFQVALKVWLLLKCLEVISSTHKITFYVFLLVYRISNWENSTVTHTLWYEDYNLVLVLYSCSQLQLSFQELMGIQEEKLFLLIQR